MSGPRRPEPQGVTPSPDAPAGSAPRGSAPRDPGDAWVTAEDGTRYWGRFGAAGLLAHDPARGILLQHRVEWSDHGNTWGIPGGARHEGEDAVTGAIREAHEEAGVPLDAIQPRFAFTVDRGGWTYTTVIAETIRAFEPEITDPESKALAWVPIEAVADFDLHPGFGSTWPLLRSLLAPDVEPTVGKLTSNGRLIRL